MAQLTMDFFVMFIDDSVVDGSLNRGKHPHPINSLSPFKCSPLQTSLQDFSRVSFVLQKAL